MNFFDRQDKVKRKSRIFFCAFIPAVLLAVAGLYFAITLCFMLAYNIGTVSNSADVTVNGFNHERIAALVSALPETIYGSPPKVLSPQPIRLIGGAILLVTLLASLSKYIEIRKGGGAYIARQLKGEELTEPKNSQEKRLVNIVDEMAIASGLPRPRIFILRNEYTINAATAGLTPNDAVIAVTQGALNQLNRNELQGVIAHEFAHILNGDYRLNLTMAGWLYGLLLFSILGATILGLIVGLGGAALGDEKTEKSKKSGFLDSSIADLVPGKAILFIILLAVIGLILKAAGSAGHTAAGLIEAAFCRTRVHLADAFAAQFTRDPKGLSDALRKIGSTPKKAKLKISQALAMKSFFFVNPAGGKRGFFLSSHPSLKSRIRALDPKWDKTFIPINLQYVPEEGALIEPSIFDDDYVSGNTDNGLSRSSAEGLKRLPEGWVKALMLAMAAEVSAKDGPSAAYAELSGDSLAAAKKLSWPAALALAVKNEDQLEALIYAVFLNSETQARQHQLAIIEKAAGKQLAELAEQLEKSLNHTRKLALLELANPSLKRMPGREQKRLIETVRELIAADGQADIFEIAGELIVSKAVDSFADRNSLRRSYEQMYLPRLFDSDASAVLSYLAGIGAGSRDEAEKAFKTCAVYLPLPEAPGKTMEYIPINRVSSEDVSFRLKRLSDAPQKMRTGLIRAALACALHDRKITVREYDFLCALAAALSIPLPWLAIKEAAL